MFFIMGDRNALIQLLPKGVRWAEIGVYRGDFSQRVIESCAPAELRLVDSWKFEIEEHNPFDDTPENFSGFSGRIHWEHFGDDPNAVQELNYQYVKQRFAELPHIKVIRANSIDGLQAFEDRYFDVIYIDANHQYEYVLRDLMEARKKIKPGGILLLNDFYEGPGGAEQNLGVMGAVNTFVKRHGFHYVAMTYGAYSDVALTDDPSSPFVREFLANLNDSELVFLGINDALVPNIRYKVHAKRDGRVRYLPLF